MVLALWPSVFEKQGASFFVQHVHTASLLAHQTLLACRTKTGVFTTHMHWVVGRNHIELNRAGNENKAQPVSEFSRISRQFIGFTLGFGSENSWNIDTIVYTPGK